MFAFEDKKTYSFYEPIIDCLFHQLISRPLLVLQSKRSRTTRLFHPGNRHRLTLAPVQFPANPAERSEASVNNTSKVRRPS
jgi:hypothetical protein